MDNQIAATETNAKPRQLTIPRAQQLITLAQQLRALAEHCDDFVDVASNGPPLRSEMVGLRNMMELRIQEIESARETVGDWARAVSR